MKELNKHLRTSALVMKIIGWGTIVGGGQSRSSPSMKEKARLNRATKRNKEIPYE